MAIYRRGALYWWRRNLPYRPADLHPITLRISLRTSCARTAKARAAALELEWESVATAVNDTLRLMPTREDLARVYKLAFQTELNRIIVRQAETPMLSGEHAVLNRAYARLFTLLAGCTKPPHPDMETQERLVAEGLAPDEATRLHALIVRHQDSLPITPNQIGAYLVETGVRATDHNKKAVGRIVAAAYRNACLEGSEALGCPMPPGTVWPLPGNLMGLLGLPPHPHDVLPAAAPSATMETDPAEDSSALREPVPASPAPVPAPSASDDDVSITELAAAALATRIAANAWHHERAREVGGAVKLFVAANGDIAFSTIRQRHLAAMVALFPQLPTKYGSARKDRITGEWTQEPVQAALERGRELRKLWDKDPVEAEQQRLPRVGLAPVTHNRHLTWLRALVSYAESAGLPAPQGLDFAALRVKGNKARRAEGGGAQKKNQALRAFAPDDLRHLLTAPIWTGCADLWRRFETGNLIYHDAWYWCPLILALHGCRSDEACGLALNDIDTEAAIPTLHIRPNAFRRVKTAASDRMLPIHPLLIGLGFLDYVRAMRAAGHKAAFPELMHATLSFDHNFYDKIFEPLRACQFPHGTSRKRGRKDVDVRSIRSTCVTHLRNVLCPKNLAQAIVGHEVGDVTSDIYEEDPEPALLLPWIEKLGDLVPDIPPRPLTLRPREWQKFGAPRGRRVKP